METLRVGLCGLGTVGQGVVHLLQKNNELISGRCGCNIRIVRIANRSEKPELNVGGAVFSTRVEDLIEDDEVDVIVEAIGGNDTAVSLIRAAIQAKKHVVTANKALIAEYGNELIPQAQEAGLFLGYEAAVAGGIPVLKALREGLAGNRITRISGIINGTSNFILSAMSRSGDDFATALQEAQNMGYAETDPGFDIDGVDAAHKLCILAALAFGTPLRFDSVYIEGISSISVDDIQYAKAMGYRIKHLGICVRDATGVSLRVHPSLVPAEQMLASIEGVMNAVQIESDAVGTSMYCGPGAGAAPTASSVVADLVDLARGNTQTFGHDKTLPGIEIQGIQSAYYLRIPAVDKPGVLAEIAQLLSNHGISIEALSQREANSYDNEKGSWVPVVIITDRVLEATMDKALASINASSHVVGKIMRIRVEPGGALSSNSA
jgi:homoserine dehydrogenase